MIRGIHHFAVHVRELDAMRSFYIEAFGFKDLGFEGSWKNNSDLDEIVDLRDSAARSAMLVCGNCFLELFHYSRPEPEEVTHTHMPYQHGYTHFCVDVVDIEKEVERLSGLGMRFDRPHGRGKPVNVGIVKAIYGRDPEGNLIELQETLPGCKFDARVLPKADMVK